MLRIGQQTCILVVIVFGGVERLLIRSHWFTSIVCLRILRQYIKLVEILVMTIVLPYEGVI